MNKKNIYLIILLIFCVSGCKATKETKIYDVQFSEAERIILQRFNIDKVGLLKDWSYAYFDDEIGKYMKTGPFYAKLEDHLPGKELRFYIHQDYDIGATGAEKLTLELKKINDNQTEIMVDYLDKWKGIMPPFIYTNHGAKKERKIIERILEKGNSPSKYTVSKAEVFTPGNSMNSMSVNIDTAKAIVEKLPELNEWGHPKESNLATEIFDIPPDITVYLRIKTKHNKEIDFSFTRDVNFVWINGRLYEINDSVRTSLESIFENIIKKNL